MGSGDQRAGNMRKETEIRYRKRLRSTVPYDTSDLFFREQTVSFRVRRVQVSRRYIIASCTYLIT